MKKDQKNIYLYQFKSGGIYKILMLMMASFALVLMNSCKKLLEVKPAGASLLTANVFTDSVTVQSALVNLYLSTTYRYPTSTLSGFSADELQYLGTNFDAYTNNALLAADDGTTLWNNPYTAIYNANAIIEGTAASTGISARFKAQAQAEARFMRAFYYFYLVNFFGDVPLVLSTDVSLNSKLPRSPAADVYTQIISDLKFAQANLPADYSISAGTRTRANKWIATAMLAKVDLYIGNWTDAETQASALITNTALFGLQDDLTKVFAPSNTEAIWQFYNDPSGYTQYAFTVLPNAITKIPTYYLTPSLVSAFEAGDARKTNWTTTLAYNSINYTYPAKYKSVATGANAEYFTVLRLAEIFLIRAEARAQQNNLTGSLTDVTVIRKRAGLGNATAADKASLLLAIEQERRVELFCENGNRWFDLKRTGRVNDVIGMLKPTLWKPAAALYPIPALAISLNLNLKQNPGYN